MTPIGHCDASRNCGFRYRQLRLWVWDRGTLGAGKCTAGHFGPALCTASSVPWVTKFWGTTSMLVGS